MKHLLPLLICFCCLNQLSAQNIRVETFPKFYNSKALDASFEAYDIFESDPTSLYSQLEGKDKAILEMEFGGENKMVELYPVFLLDDEYESTIVDEQGEYTIYEQPSILTFKGQIQKKTSSLVTLTVSEDYIYGMIEEDGQTFYFEPASFFDPSIAKSDVVYYNSSAVKTTIGTCAAEDTRKYGESLAKEEFSDEEMRMMCSVKVIELAIATDYSMFVKYGSRSALKTRNIGVMNNVAANFDDEFQNAIVFKIRKHFTSQCSACDPWTNSLSASALLSSFRSWGNAGGFNKTFDLGQLWTNRNFSGSTVGIAYLSAVCGNSRYHALQDFTSNACTQRVLVAHEIGHNMGSNHTNGGIMNASVICTNSWNSASVTSINNRVNSVTCLDNGCKNKPIRTSAPNRLRVICNNDPQECKTYKKPCIKEYQINNPDPNLIVTTTGTTICIESAGGGTRNTNLIITPVDFCDIAKTPVTWTIEVNPVGQCPSPKTQPIAGQNAAQFELQQADGYLRLINRSLSEAPKQFRLVDVSGRVWESGQMLDNYLEMDMSELPTGILFLQVYNDQEMETYKVFNP